MSAFAPAAAVVVHSHADLSAAVLEILKAEDVLLVHRCTRSASRTTRRAVDVQGRCFLRVDLDPVLRFQVSASVLEAGGLADYHPGRKLSAQALTFANGADLPFQFSEGPAVFIYENPTLDPGPGDLPSIEFGIAVEFSDLDLTNHAATTSDGGPGGSDFAPSVFASIPAQTAVAIDAASRNALLLDIFTATDSFGTASLTATLYNGSPTASGEPLNDPLNISTWTTLDEPVSAWITRARNHSQIEWGAGYTSSAARSATHIRLTRNDIVVRDIALAATLSIPAFYGVQAAANALGLLLTWTRGGASTEQMAQVGLPYVLGTAGTGITTAETLLTVKCYDGDPNATGTLLNAFTVPRDATTWDVVASAVSNKIALVGGTNPGPGDWVTAYVTVEMAGVAELLISQFLSGNVTTTSGNALTLPIGAVVQTIA